MFRHARFHQLADVTNCQVRSWSDRLIPTAMMRSQTTGDLGRSRNPTPSVFGMVTPTAHTNHSDPCIARSVGRNLSTRMMTAWHRGRTGLNQLLGNTTPETRTTHERILQSQQSQSPLPYDIVEMIIAHITYDLPALKALSLTCRSWYITAFPHLHHTITLVEDTHITTRDKLDPLSRLHELGLAPLIKEIRVNQPGDRYAWFVPGEFSRRDLHYFSAFANVHTLKLQNLDIFRFIPHLKRYFVHLSPTLRSIILDEPRCDPQQLSQFISLFSNLDDVEIQNPIAYDVGPLQLVSSSTPTPWLRGRLAL